MATMNVSLPDPMKAWVEAQAACLADVGQPAHIYCPGIELSEDVKKHLLANCKNSIRRVCVNLERTREFCRVEGLTQLDCKTWGDRGFFQTETPKPTGWNT